MGLVWIFFISLGLGFCLRVFALLQQLFFALLFICYGLKILLFRNSVKAELHHPIKINFFPAFSISLLLLAALFSEFSGVSKALFYAGVAVLGALCVFMSFWHD